MSYAGNRWWALALEPVADETWILFPHASTGEEAAVSCAVLAAAKARAYRRPQTWEVVATKTHVRAANKVSCKTTWHRYLVDVSHAVHAREVEL